MKKNNQFPLTLSQSDIFFDQLFHAETPLYNLCGFLRFNRIDVKRLAEAHERLINEHDIFGIRIAMDNNHVKQSITQNRTVALLF